MGYHNINPPGDVRFKVISYVESQYLGKKYELKHWLRHIIPTTEARYWLDIARKADLYLHTTELQLSVIHTIIWSCCDKIRSIPQSTICEQAKSSNNKCTAAFDLVARCCCMDVSANNSLPCSLFGLSTDHKFANHLLMLASHHSTCELFVIAR